MLSQNWQYNKNLDTWVFGTSHNGAGVLLDENLWYGNVVVQGHTTGIGPFDTKEEAQEEAEQVYKEITDRLKE